MKSFANGPRSARYTILGLLGAVLALFAACDVAGLDAIGKSGEPSSDAVTLRVALEGAAPRTIGPELPAIARYELVTWLADESLKILGSWEDLAEANVAIEPGVWDFALTAYDVFGRPLLTGMLLDRAVIGPGTLSFALSDTKQGTGSVSLRVSFRLRAASSRHGRASTGTKPCSASSTTRPRACATFASRPAPPRTITALS